VSYSAFHLSSEVGNSSLPIGTLNWVTTGKLGNQALTPIWLLRASNVVKQ